MTDRVSILNNQLAKLLQAIPATGQPAGPGREMTFLEKRKLSSQLSRLQGVPDMLKSVLNIISSDPLVVSAAGGEVEVEIDQLRADTLWKLHALVAAKPAASMPASAAVPSKPVAAPPSSQPPVAEKKPPVQGAASVQSSGV